MVRPSIPTTQMRLCTPTRLLCWLLTLATVVSLTYVIYRTYQPSTTKRRVSTKPFFKSLSSDIRRKKSKKNADNCRVLPVFYKDIQKAEQMKLTALSWNYVWFDMKGLESHPTLKAKLRQHRGHLAKHSQIAAMFENSKNKSETIMVTAETFYQTKTKNGKKCTKASQCTTYPMCRQVQFRKGMKSFKDFRGLVKKQERENKGEDGSFYDFKALETLRGLKTNPTKYVDRSITQKEFWRLVNMKYSGKGHIYNLVTENCNTFVRDMWKALTRNHEYVQDKWLPSYGYFAGKMKGKEETKSKGAKHS